MKVVIISTVGVSLLMNYKKAANITDENYDKINATDVINFIDSDPYKASAETNSLLRMLRILEKEGFSERDLYLYFLVSDTVEGKFCADMLSEFFKRKFGIPATRIVIQGLKYDESSFLYVGLQNLLEEVVNLVRNHKGRRIIINATGGFKAEIAYLTVIGVLLGLEVYYIHEKFRDIVKLPRLPVKVDRNELNKFLDIVNNVREIRMAELEEKAKELGVSPEFILSGSIVTEKNGELYLEPSKLYLLLSDILSS